MRTLRVAAISMNGYLGEPVRVLDGIDNWCEQAQAAGAELLLFPELVLHGHCTPNTWEVAEAVPSGPSVTRLLELAQKYNQVLCVGLSEKERDVVYNTQVLVGPDGFIGKQRKLHMSRDERDFYKEGREISVFDIGDCRVAIDICYDGLFPEVARIQALHGADVLLMPHAFRQKMWIDTPGSETAAREFSRELFMLYGMRARENACFAVITDQVGRAGYVDTLPRDHRDQPHHAGGALVFGPSGELLEEAQRVRIQEEMIVTSLDAQKLRTVRADPTYPLRVRRPELFAELGLDQRSA